MKNRSRHSTQHLKDNLRLEKGRKRSNSLEKKKRLFIKGNKLKVIYKVVKEDATRQINWKRITTIILFILLFFFCFLLQPCISNFHLYRSA